MSRRRFRHVVLGTLATLLTGMSIAGQTAPTRTNGQPQPDLPLRRAAVMQLVTDQANPLGLSAAESETLRGEVILVVEGLERQVLRQTRLQEDLPDRWLRLDAPSAHASPEQSFLHDTAKAEQLLETALAGEAEGEADELDVVSDEWFEEALPEEERLSLEELGRLVDQVSRECTPEEAAVLLPQARALRQDIQNLQTAWDAIDRHLDSPERAALVAAQVERLRGNPVPDVLELGIAWADED